MNVTEAKAAKCLPTSGTLVRIVAKILPKSECGGFLVKEKHIEARKAGAVGIYKGWVAGAGGDLWWVEHNDSSVGAYMFNEVEDLEPKKEKVVSTKIEENDLVRVNFNNAQITLCKYAKVLRIPCATGDSWIFLDLQTDKLHYVSEGCTITKLEPSDIKMDPKREMIQDEIQSHAKKSSS